MGIIQDRSKVINSLIDKVRSHHMCFRFIDEGSSYIVLYPCGDWPVSGSRVRYTSNKAIALNKLLEKMDEHYEASVW